MNTVTNSVVKNYHKTYLLSINSLPLTVEQMKSDVLCYIYFSQSRCLKQYQHFMKTHVAGVIRDYKKIKEKKKKAGRVRVSKP